MAYHDKGAYAEAIAAERRIYAVFGDRELEAALGRGYAEAGYRGAMRRAAEVVVARPGAADLMPVSVAQFYVHAGEKERALEWLERAYQARDPNLPYLGLPDWDSVRGDPRFKDLLRRMRLPG
jgi:tetratricopeptide (TPR) repeat protein